jgi:hypothetical protein
MTASPFVPFPLHNGLAHHGNQTTSFFFLLIHYKGASQILEKIGLLYLSYRLTFQPIYFTKRSRTSAETKSISPSLLPPISGLVLLPNPNHNTTTTNINEKINMSAISAKDIPRLTGQSDYAPWKCRITAAFLILDLTSTINPLAPTPAPISTLPPDPLPCLSLNQAPSHSNLLSDPEQQALALLTARKREWKIARQAEEATLAEERALREAEEKRKDETALGWMFLTMEGMLAQDVLLWCSTKRDSRGALRKAELRELDARTVWEKLREKYGG